MPPLYSRHPRFTIALLGLIFISILLFANSEPHDPLFNSAGLHRGGSLAQSLAVEEVRYQKFLDRRQDLIRKWGPTPDKIDPFPSHGEFYTLWDFFLPYFRCPHHIDRVGVMGDGGKWVCGLERIIPKKKCVMYSFGINGESSFEADIMKVAPGCELYGYDFSVNSFGPEIELESDLKRRSHFFSYGLGPKDAFTPADNPKFYSLRTLMARNGHDFIDVLKVDIEGGEFDSLEVFIDTSARIARSVQSMGTLPKFLEWWEKLETAGLRPFFFEPNLVYVNLVRGVRPELIEYAFINIRGSHELVSDRPLPRRRISQ
ncbi:methyltransferase domain-containing protein [Boletus reticuloceps]|uniref:Methyltransferase domain-containing protein n=1 Tax=Boletus reticuloceps TaxID=495285 RepID=A0A8I2YXV2_9AGAM|nr:methyltransferase domain-containing protein [Boletus reticuloceps]